MLMRDRILWHLSYISTTWPETYPGLTIEYGRDGYGPLSIYVIVKYDGHCIKRVFNADDSMINDDAHFDLIKDTIKAIRDDVIDKGEAHRRIKYAERETCYAERDMLDAYSYLPFYITPMPKPKKIILNDPATIILWSDNTKTIVKKNSKDKKFDPEKGIALCYMKKALGNSGNYNNVFKDWIK